MKSFNLETILQVITDEIYDMNSKMEEILLKIKFKQFQKQKNVLEIGYGLESDLILYFEKTKKTHEKNLEEKKELLQILKDMLTSVFPGEDTQDIQVIIDDLDKYLEAKAENIDKKLIAQIENKIKETNIMLSSLEEKEKLEYLSLEVKKPLGQEAKEIYKNSLKALYEIIFIEKVFIKDIENNINSNSLNRVYQIEIAVLETFKQLVKERKEKKLSLDIDSLPLDFFTKERIFKNLTKDYISGFEKLENVTQLFFKDALQAFDLLFINEKVMSNEVFFKEVTDFSSFKEEENISTEYIDEEKPADQEKPVDLNIPTESDEKF